MSSEKMTPVEKRSIALMLLGTVLEYFDFVLYVHLAVVLVPLFFPSQDKSVQDFLAVFTFLMSYLLRPIGSFVFGYVGDKIGRKASIVWTSVLMGIASLTVGCLPTYSAIGIAAPVIFILARGLQGFSSIGEVIGARVFIAEVAKKSSYPNFLTTLAFAAMSVGSILALGAGTIFVRMDPLNGWRWPYLIGSTVAFVGGLIRLRCIESPVFLEHKARKANPSEEEVFSFVKILEFRRRNYWCYFAMEAIAPLAFYVCMSYFSSKILKEQLGLSPADVMAHNFFVTLIQLGVLLGWGFLGDRYGPWEVTKKRLWTGFFVVPPAIILLIGMKSQAAIFCLQLLTLTFAGGIAPANYKIIQSFPVIGRCTNIGSGYAIVHVFMYIVASAGVVALDKYFGFWGVAGLFQLTLTVSIIGFYLFTPVDAVEEKTRLSSLETKWVRG
jgi:MFS family permease